MRDPDDQAGIPADGGDLGFDAYQAARDRFFVCLRADAELQRLEALWRDSSEDDERPYDDPSSIFIR